MTDKERVKKTILWLISEGIAKSQKSIAEIMGYNISSFSQIVTGDKPVSEKFLKKLVGQSERINYDWLKTGDGEMLVSEIKSDNSNESPILLSSLNLTIAPLISLYAQPGYLNGLYDKNFLDKQPLYFATQKYTGVNFVAFEVRGDSMDNGQSNAICNGDVVLGQELPYDYRESNLLTPRVYIIIHKKEGILLREIVKHDSHSDRITCHAFNKDKVRFPDFDLNLDDLLGLFYIKELKRGGY